MDKLKTLKDLRTRYGKFEDSDVEEFKVVLKEEITKHLLHLREYLKEEQLLGGKHENWEYGVNPTLSRIEAKISWIEYFFNIEKDASSTKNEAENKQ